MAILTNASDIHLYSSQAMGIQATVSSFSITCWINTTWNSGGRNSFIGIYGPSTDTPLGAPVTAVQIGTTAGVGTLDCWTWGGGILVSASTAMTALNGTWVHAVYTFDGTTHRVYVNGALAGTSTAAQIAGYLNQIYINGYPGGGTSEVAVQTVDQYSFFNRTLSAGEVQTMYNASGARHGITWGLLARFEFDEGVQGSTVSTVPDLSGNVNSLATTGGGTVITYTYTNSYADSNIRPVQ